MCAHILNEHSRKNARTKYKVQQINMRQNKTPRSSWLLQLVTTSLESPKVGFLAVGETLACGKMWERWYAVADVVICSRQNCQLHVRLRLRHVHDLHLHTTKTSMKQSYDTMPFSMPFIWFWTKHTYLLLLQCLLKFCNHSIVIWCHKECLGANVFNGFFHLADDRLLWREAQLIC